jgi:hypothetical protein
MNSSVNYVGRLALWSLCGCLLMALQLGQLQPAQASQTRSLSSDKFEKGLKWLGAVMEGNTARVAKPAGGYDAYKYDAFRYEGCDAGWVETHESSDDGVSLRKEAQWVMVPLARLDQSSVREDKIGKSVFLVSFTTLKQKPEIGMRLQEPTDNLASAFASGAGLYFESEVVAKRVANTLVRSINYCQKQKHLK